MKRIIKKIQKTPVFSTLLCLLAFFLPIQQRHTSFFKPLSKKWFGAQPNIPSFFDIRLDIYIVDLIIIGLIATALWNGRRRLQSLSLERLFLLLFLCMVLISISHSGSSGYHWPYWKWAQLTLPAILVFMIPGQARKKDLLLCMGIIAIMGLFESGVGILQYVKQEAIGLKGLGEPHLSNYYSASFSMANKSRWLIDHFTGKTAPTNNILRVAGTLPHPNVLGCFLGLSLFSGCFLWLKSKKLKFLTPLLFFLMFCIFLTYSRAAILGMQGGLCLFLALAFPLVIKRKWILFTCILLTFFAICAFLLYEQIVERGGIVNYNAVARGSDAMRLSYQQVAFSMMKSHPFLGVGWGQFLIEMPHFIPSGVKMPPLQTVHNLYLVLGAETGLVGLTLFLGFIGSSLWRLWKSPRSLERALFFSFWFFLLWYGCCDHFLITTEHGRIMFFLIAGLCARSAQEKRLLRPILAH